MKLVNYCFGSALVISLWCLYGCDLEGVQLPEGEEAWPRLSDYAFFEQPLSDLNGNRGVIPYDLKTPLFSNYAEKARFIWMPVDSQATVQADGSIIFPNRTVLIKNFFYHKDFRRPSRGKQILETRLLVKTDSGWKPYSYVWNDRQTDAELKPLGDIKDVSWIDTSGTQHELPYIIPDINQCQSCHEHGKLIMPIGPNIGNLDKSFVYDDGEKNQLSKWVEAGYLSSGDWPSYPSIAKWDDTTEQLNERARAYLAVNCGTCHSPAGSAYNSGLYLTTTEHRSSNLGICKSPVSAGKGSGGRHYDIVPGEPESSILLYRMQVDDPGARMPEVGRQIPHEEGIELISEWIAGLQGTCAS